MTCIGSGGTYQVSPFAGSDLSIPRLADETIEAPDS